MRWLNINTFEKYYNSSGEHVFFDIDIKGGEKEGSGCYNWRSKQPFRVAINAKGGDCWHVSVDTERGVNQYQVQFKNLFQLILKPFNYIQ
jgi:hypothetical protein